MTGALARAMPAHGLVGGLMIGVSAAIMLLALGRIAGISGLAARTAGLSSDGAWSLAAAFVLGLPLGTALVVHLLRPDRIQVPVGLPALIVSGLLVGFGTRLGSGCTSGHGVCGLARLSPRSLVATTTFMASGVAIVAALRFAGLLR
jgi:uncharacterized membrane protein YedE/YeeE